MSSEDREETTKMEKKSLKTLQYTASDRENLVGRPNSLKHQLSHDGPEVKPKVSCKQTQVNIDTRITAEDLTGPTVKSEKYWELLAEKRQVALQDALNENAKLCKIIEDLKEENALFKQMLDEANSFVEVIKEELANSSNNDTGIDVNDVSAVDETEDEIETKTAKLD